MKTSAKLFQISGFLFVVLLLQACASTSNTTSSKDVLELDAQQPALEEQVNYEPLYYPDYGYAGFYRGGAVHGGAHGR